jgi:hypothetical protein
METAWMIGRSAAILTCPPGSEFRGLILFYFLKMTEPCSKDGHVQPKTANNVKVIFGWIKPLVRSNQRLDLSSGFVVRGVRGEDLG